MHTLYVYHMTFLFLDSRKVQVDTERPSSQSPPPAPYRGVWQSQSVQHSWGCFHRMAIPALSHFHRMAARHELTGAILDGWTRLLHSLQRLPALNRCGPSTTGS